jgi:fumarate reductase subunit C
VTPAHPANPPNPDYRLYHPRPYRRRMPIFWWLERAAYVKFIARELTAVPVAYAALLLLAEAWALGRGEAAFRRLNELLAAPWALVLHGAVAAALLFHAFTWLHLAPKAMEVRLGGRRVPDGAILAGQYLGWLGATALVAWLLLAG